MYLLNTERWLRLWFVRFFSGGFSHSFCLEVGTNFDNDCFITASHPISVSRHSLHMDLLNWRFWGISVIYLAKLSFILLIFVKHWIFFSASSLNFFYLRTRWRNNYSKSFLLTRRISISQIEPVQTNKNLIQMSSNQRTVKVAYWAHSFSFWRVNALVV